jgi:hypothetical protein
VDQARAVERVHARRLPDGLTCAARQAALPLRVVLTRSRTKGRGGRAQSASAGPGRLVTLEAGAPTFELSPQAIKPDDCRLARV